MITVFDISYPIKFPIHWTKPIKFVWCIICSLKIWIDVLVEEMKLVDMEKNEFEKREKSRLLAFFDIFCLRIAMKSRKTKSLALKDLPQVD